MYSLILLCHVFPPSVYLKTFLIYRFIFTGRSTSTFFKLVFLLISGQLQYIQLSELGIKLFTMYKFLSFINTLFEPPSSVIVVILICVITWPYLLEESLLIVITWMQCLFLLQITSYLQMVVVQVLKLKRWCVM